jgi:tRNA(fMet)-specific endonuclease VapC
VGVVLDTSILVAAERRAVRFEALLESLGEESVAVAAITASELLHGCHRASDPGTRARRAAFVDALLDALLVLPFGLPEARTGSAIGPHDLLIAATALAQGHALATVNQRGFSRVPGLRLAATERYLP